FPSPDKTPGRDSSPVGQIYSSAGQPEAWPPTHPPPFYDVFLPQHCSALSHVPVVKTQGHNTHRGLSRRVHTLLRMGVPQVEARLIVARSPILRLHAEKRCLDPAES